MAVVRRMATLTLVGALLLAGCDGAPTERPRPSAEPSTSATRDAGPTTVSVSVYGDRAVVSAYRAIAQRFMTDNPSVTVQMTSTRDADAAARATETALGTGTTPDVFLLESTALPNLVQSGAVQPLDGLLEDRGLNFGDDYQRVGLTACSAADELQCMPAEVSPLVVYYNKALVPKRALRRSGFTFPRRGDIWLWEDFAAAARSVAGVDQLGPIKGTYLPDDVDLVAALVRSAGIDMVDDDVRPTTLRLSDPRAVEALGQVAALAHDPAVSLTPADVAQQDAVDWFADGELALLIGTRADLPRLRAAPGLRFDVVSLPAFSSPRSVSQVSGWCLSADTEVTVASADFIAYAVGPRAARIVAATGEMVPARLDALGSTAFVQPGRLPRHLDAFVAGAKRSDPLPYSVRWPDVESLIEDALGPVFTDPDLNVDTILTPLLQQVDAASVPLLSDDGSAG